MARKKEPRRQQVVSKETAGQFDQPVSPIGRIVRQVKEEEAGKDRPREPKRKVSPSEQRRKSRRMNLTFSDAAICDRVRALAERWGLRTRGGLPNPGAVVEYLLLPRLRAAEKGEIPPPREEDA